LAMTILNNLCILGKSNPTSPTAFRGKDQDLPYSVETPYGYRLDLDFLKYVDDIEKGHTIKKVPIHRRPRYSSLPRGYGYTGSWWTSTESLCSNASMDSRYSSFSYCGRGFYPAYGVENRPPLLTSGYNARVEKTLLDAKRRLEEDQADSAEDRRSRFASLGSLHGSVSGSTSSLSGAGLSQSLSKMSSHSNSQSGVSGQYTPMSSGLSTPVSPTPAHLQHVREQMAVALRKLRQLEEQVKMIPVLQVKISVLQEEKRQLSVQLKSQKFLGHTTGFGKPKPRGELYIDIPEEDSDQSGSVFSPPLPGSSRSHSGTEIEGSMMQRSLIKSPKKEMRSISVGTGEEMMVRESRPSASVGLGQTREVKEVGISVKEHDLGLSSVATQAEVEHQRQTIEALAAKISVLEKQLKKALQELQVAHQKLEQQAKEITEREKATKPSTADAIIMTKLAEVSEVGLQTSNQLELVDQRTMGVQVYISEQPTSGTKDYKEVPASPAVPVNLQAPVPQRTEPVESSTVGAPKNEGAYLDQVPVFKTLFTSKTEVPYILYKNPEAVETVFPIQADHCTEVLHVVKKISLTTETYEDKLKGVDDPAVLEKERRTPNKRARGLEEITKFTSKKIETGIKSSNNTLIPLEKMISVSISSEEVSEVLQKPSQMIVLSASSAPVAVEMGGTVLSASAQQEGPPSPEANTCSSSVASEQGSALSTRDAPQPGNLSVRTAQLGNVPACSMAQPGKAPAHGVACTWHGLVTGLYAVQHGLVTRPYAVRHGLVTRPYAVQHSPVTPRHIAWHGLVRHLTHRAARSGSTTHMRCGRHSLARHPHTVQHSLVTGPHRMQHGPVTCLCVTLNSLSMLSSVEAYKSLFLHTQAGDHDVGPCDFAVDKLERQVPYFIYCCASPETSLKSIMKRKDDTAFLDPASRKNLQFVGVNGGYESTSSDTSSEDSSSENESSESEYHEANEGPPAGHAGQPAEQKPQEMETSDTNNNEKEDSEGEKPTLVTAAAGESASSEEATEQKFQMSESLLSASMTLQKYLENPDAVSNMAMKAAYATVLQDWLRISCHKAADQNVVRHHMIVFQAMSPQLLEFVVNMADGNGNTALHYTVSHSNFPIVRLLLETGMCNVDKQNKAGYTAIMLTALAAFRSEGDMETVTQLLHHGNVNAKASQAGQTALMLAVSHGRIDMVKALLAGGADVNLQDDDGSTALMCACEHGHVEIVRLLLAVPGCDVTLTDNDGSTALSVALEANQNEIAMLLHSHMNLTKALAPSNPVKIREVSPGFHH
uniref:KN motif and ankyrin repeat domain-containing protein 2 n=1 Tax=Latimeria chalumnae TaxID=7897 RepID=H3AJV3_LATCH